MHKKNPPPIEYIDKMTRISVGKPVPVFNDTDTTRERTIAYKILRSHETVCTLPLNPNAPLSLKFDALISHDITYVSIIQTARNAGLTHFPVPYTLTNCHNSLCAAGGTINEDDHAFGLSAARKYGGIFVPGNLAVIHQYAREVLAGCGRMILGSDSHTRYGCFGALGIGEGGGELVKQLLERTYDTDAPEVTLVWLEGSPRQGIGPHDVALALIKETFPGGKVKNKILEFAGPGISSLSMDFRAGIDVMTTETSALSSIWETDGTVQAYYKAVGREKDFTRFKTTEDARYDSLVRVDLSRIESMIALPFHPSKAVTIHELQSNPEQILREAQDACNDELSSNVRMDLLGCIDEHGEVACEQGVIVGCAGGMFDNISEAADILENKSIGNGFFDLSIYPASMPISLDVMRHGCAETLLNSGAVIKPAFCGPCFGAGDTPAHNTLSIRHATRNFANREGSKPGSGQISAVALMDARSIAATAVNGGVLTAATDIDYSITPRQYRYDGGVYKKRCYNGYGNPEPGTRLRLGPNITDWPEFTPLNDNLLLRLCAVIGDEVTTTDEIIPSGETSSYRSNPIALAEFTLSRRVPEYVELSKAVTSGACRLEAEQVLSFIGGEIKQTTVGSCIFAKKPGDGSAREQAASCQRVLGGRANISYEYATARYRSNCINWGILPFTIDKNEPFDYSAGDWIYIEGLRKALLAGEQSFSAKVLAGAAAPETHGLYITTGITLRCENLSEAERAVIADGCLMNHYSINADKERIG